MTKHSHFPYTSTRSSIPHNTNRKHNIHHILYTNIQYISTLQCSKPTIFNNSRYTTNIPTDLHTVITTDKTNMYHIHTYIVSKHLATRGNNKKTHTPPLHIGSSEEILPCLTTCHILVQLRTDKSPFLKSYLHKVDTKSHPSPLCPLSHTGHTSSLQLHPHTHHVVTPRFVDRPFRSDGTTG